MVREDGEAPAVQDEPEVADTSKTGPQHPVKRAPLQIKSNQIIYLSLSQQHSTITYMGAQHLIKRTYSGGGFVLLCWSRWAECRIGIEQALFSSRSWGTVKADKLHANKGLKIKRKKQKPN